MMVDRLEQERLKSMEYYGFGPNTMKKIKVCTECGQASGSGQQYCVVCGSRLPEKTLYDIYKERHEVCGNCDTVLAEGMEYCPQCGTKVKDIVKAGTGIHNSFSALLGILVLMIILTGCGQAKRVTETNSEPVPEKASEVKTVQEQISEQSKEDMYFGSSIFEILSGENGVEVSEEPATETAQEPEDPLWPQNEYTALLPKPDMAIASAGLDENGFIVDFADNVTVAEIIAYAQIVEEKGFNIDVEIDARSHNDVPRYYYSALNKEGYDVELYWYSSGSGLVLRK